jgi:S1-C subfamily serine protease
MPVVTNGALIVDIKADGPAAKAGILVGDVVTRFDGHWIPNQFALRNRESHMAPGTQVALSVLRNGNPLDFNLVLAEKPTPAQAQAATSAPQ